ncbi:Pex19 protein family domain-containing protein [Trichoderma gracile]
MSSPSEAADPTKREESGAKQGEAQPAPAPAPAPTAAVAAPPAATVSDDVDDVPDPDEDDLDDLDELLDGFKAVRQEMINDNTLKEGPEAADLDYDNMSEEEVTKRMQAGIAGLLANLEQSPELQAQFEEMFKQMGAEMGAAMEEEEQQQEQQSSSKDKSTPAPSATPSAAAPAPAAASAAAPAAPPTGTPQPPREGSGGAAFQDTIRRTMERMQTSGEQATAAAAAGGDDDFLSEMLKQLTSGEFAGGSEEDFSKMLMGMMEQLTNKEILYEPMKELHDKFPAWLAKNKDSVPADDLKRYMEQKVIVEEIVAKFNEPTYSDSNAADREYIVDRMQKMQAAGSPPSDLVGDMASAQEAFNSAEDQCTPQ